MGGENEVRCDIEKGQDVPRAVELFFLILPLLCASFAGLFLWWGDRGMAFIYGVGTVCLSGFSLLLLGRPQIHKRAYRSVISLLLVVGVGLVAWSLV